MSTLLMVRHAESTANLASRYTWHDHEPLTELGHRQAREAGRLLAEQYEPSHLYCSRFRRARQTADEIAAEVGVPVVEVDGIEERCFGELRGKPWEVYRTAVADLDVEEFWHHRAPGGESLVDVASRAAPVVAGLADRHQGRQVIVVSHGGVMAALRAWIAGTWRHRPTPTRNANGFRLDRNGSHWMAPSPLFDT
ncbi:MAG: histidine phosphatase family protein [Acidobacteriota bacterium]|nr:histidine phosphatase family protein [Acidobacteriota bacterium]